MTVYKYETELYPGAIVTFTSDVRLPTGKGWPLWLSYSRLHDIGQIKWVVECEICNKWTGRKRNRRTLAKFLHTHRRCGFLNRGDQHD